MTRIFVLTGRVASHNVGGNKIDVAVVGPHGAWTVAEAGELIITGQAVFVDRGGERTLSLSQIPEVHDPR